jgi:hypothetical protein
MSDANLLSDPVETIGLSLIVPAEAAMPSDGRSAATPLPGQSDAGFLLTLASFALLEVSALLWYFQVL